MDAETHEVPAPAGRFTALRSKLPKAPDRSPASVFIVGTPFSGSTLIGRDMTTRIPKAHYVGELNNYTKFPGLSGDDDYGRVCGPCDLLGRRCPHFSDAFRESASYDDILGMHAQLARSLGASVVIDGSKYVGWLRHALAQWTAAPGDRTAPKVIITARNPIAFAFSHQHRTGQQLWQGANIWRDIYVDTLRTVNTRGLPNMVVRYEDYMADRESALERLAAFLHLPLEAKPDNSRLHDAGGNWSSFVPYVGIDQMNKTFERLSESARADAEEFVKHARAYWSDDKPKADTRWHRSLDAGEANTVLSTPGLADVASLVGYNVAEIVSKAVRTGR
ncbi:hypothetical protein GCM10009527_035580 [Actinomadura nitritigenes]|uniref:Sulfotransferase n=1 Tax=Actinomadura nitritigenes TaxID=134602 RepID=A0ABS3QYA0_9ACTN|nr:hypothetical protein [Actinomadura nitritigenes]MBO2438964.1 hypothetical protein [Actinomadura nitritigenes]